MRKKILADDSLRLFIFEHEKIMMARLHKGANPIGMTQIYDMDAFNKLKRLIEEYPTDNRAKNLLLLKGVINRTDIVFSPMEIGSGNSKFGVNSIIKHLEKVYK